MRSRHSEWSRIATLRIKAASITMLLVAALIAAACGTASSASTARDAAAAKPQVSNKTITFAEFPGSVPNWILPITPPSNDGSPNTLEFSYLMWRPLYWRGTGESPTIDMKISLAKPPVYSSGNRVVTVTLNNYYWSDGAPVTARDVEFFVNLVKYDTADWSDFVAGEIPADIVNFRVLNQKTFRLTLRSPVSPEWFTDDELPLITPMPQQVWDKTSTTGRVGNYDQSAAGAHAVMKYLMSQSKNTSSYARNNLWKVVDGPWRLASFSSDGYIVFHPNSRYSGPYKASYNTFEEVPFTTDTAEYNSLLAGGVDYGYIPFSDITQEASLKAQGYKVADWNLWTINYIALNYYSAAAGTLFSQLYIRQALESAVNQPQIIKSIFEGQGNQIYSAIPSTPPNPWAKSVSKNPNPYNPSRAARLLSDHGWLVRPKGLSVCRRPGLGVHQCGRGIRSGESLTFSLVYNSGNAPVTLEMQSLKSVFSQYLGVNLQLKPEPFTQVISTAFAACTAAKPAACPWQMADWGGGIDLEPYPTGEEIFSTGAGSNAEHYSNGEMNRLINASLSGGVTALANYDRYVAAQVPLLWVPNLTYQISAFKHGLTGAEAQNPYTAITPEQWHM